jgi:uncharacterized protein
MPKRSSSPLLPPTPLDHDLLGAAKAGDALRCRDLLSRGADPNAGFSEDGYFNITPLMYAAERGHTGVLEVLLAAGARLKARDRFVAPGEGGGDTALEYSLRGRRLEAARLLVRAGANLNARRGGYTPLMIATMSKDTTLVRFLLEAGADPNISNKVCSALNIAVSEDRPELAAMLLAAGADPNWRDAHFAVPPLIDAAQRGLSGCVRLLVEGGADVNAADTLGRTPLLAAAGGGVVRQLLTDEDWAEHADSPQRVGSCLLTDENAREIVELLLASGADVSARDGRGCTALSIAAEKGREEISRLLRTAGARE